MSQYINLGDLLRVAIASLGFSAVLAVVYGLGVVGMSRAGVGTTAERRPVPLAGAVVAFLVFLGAIALGIGIMAQK